MLVKLVITGIVSICDEIRLALEATLAFKNFGFQLSAIPVELCVHSYTCSAKLEIAAPWEYTRLSSQSEEPAALPARIVRSNVEQLNQMSSVFVGYFER